MKKRVFAALLLALLLALGAPAQVLADEPEAGEGAESGESSVFQDGSFSGPQTIPGEPLAIAESWEDEARALIYDGLKKCSDEIDLSSLGIPVNDFYPFYSRFLNDHPELFYVNSRCGWNFSYSTMAITKIQPGYSDIDNLDQAISDFDAASARALAQIQGLDDPVEIALVLHDWLVVNCQYNWYIGYHQSATPGSTGDPYVDSRAPWTAYGALVKGDAVCQGYALAYKYLLNRAGIPSVIISSSAMNHAWNGVQINGQWYHVDCTWDDPAPPDTAGYCGHTYFLRPDTDFPKHYGWEQIVTCGDASYTSGWAFNDCRLPFYRWNNAFYYVRPEPAAGVNGYGSYSCNSVYRTSSLHSAGTRLADGLGLATYGGAAWVDGRLYLVPGPFNGGPDQRVLVAYDLNTETAAQAGLFSYVPSESPDGLAGSDDDRNPGVRYNEESGEIEIVSPTRRQVVYSVPAASFSGGWKNAQGSGAVSFAPGLSGDGAAAVLWGSGTPESNLTLWAAFYQGEKLAAVCTAPVPEQADISNIRPELGLVYLDPPQGFDSVKLLLLTADLAPVCAAG